MITSVGSSIGVLGGSFDPVHNAHLALAEAALERISLGRVIWIPSGTPPHRAAPIASAAQRVAMLERAIGGQPRFSLDTREVRKSAPGYTVETLEALRAELGAATTLVLLIGADQYARLDTWHRWRELPSLARIAVFTRPGLDPAAGRVRDVARVTHVPIAPLEISSSAIRARIAAGQPPRGLLPDAVLDYIEREHLYSSPEHRTR